METRTQIVTQLVAAFMTDESRMQHIRNSYGGDWLYKPDYILAVDYANMVANEIIRETTEEIAFPETVV